MDSEIAAVIVTIIVLGIPIMGLTARFALKPIVESIVRLREAFANDAVVPGPNAEDVQRLEQEIGELRDQVQRLTEAAEFDRKLLNPSDN